MTRDEVKSIIKDITDEQLNGLMDLNSRDIGKAKGKSDDQKAELESLRTQLAEKDETIANLEKAKGDAATIQAELDKYKQAEAERAKAEKEAQMDAIGIAHGVGQKVVVPYVYFSILTGKGEKGTVSIIVNSDGGGNAGENSSISIDLRSVGTAPTEYTYSAV